MADNHDASTVLGSHAAAGPTVQRDAWKSIRTHIHQYEQKLLELQFDYQQKVNVVEALKLEMRQLTQNSRECEEKEFKMTQDAHNAFKDAMELDRQLMAAEKDRIMLTQQLLAEQQGLADDAKKLEDSRVTFQEHLQSQQEYDNKLAATLAAAAAGNMEAAASLNSTAAVGGIDGDVVKGCGAAEVMTDVVAGQHDQRVVGH